MENDIQDILDAFETGESFVISAHVSPDGDASGSSLALALLLRARGKKVRLAIPMNDLGAPGVLAPFRDFATDAPLEKPDWLVCLDTATVPRISLPELRDKVGIWPTLNIDHHFTNTRYGDRRYIVGDASSTGEIVFDIAKAAGWTIDRDIAEALWVAIVTDTGRFAYSCTRPSTLRCAAELLSAGVRAPWLNDELFSLVDRNVIDIHCRAEKSLETWFGGKVATIELTENDYAETGCTKSCTENFANIPRSVRSSVLAIFFYRLPGDAKTHMSIRASAPYSACVLAAQFGGGGHELAAGATVSGSIADAKAAAKDFLRTVFPQLEP